MDEWFSRFEICCKANDWDAATQAVKLPTLLEGEALAVWLELSEDDQRDYGKAKKAIKSKLLPMTFTALDEFNRRSIRPGEMIPLFLHDLKRLLDRAMPDLPNEAREQLLLHQLLAGLTGAISKQLRSTGDTKQLEPTAERARLLMMIENNLESKGVAAISQDKSHEHTEMIQLKTQIAELTEHVAALTAAQSSKRPSSVPRCFNCNGIGHVQQNCPNQRAYRTNYRRCFLCGKVGHVQKDCRSQGNDQGAPRAGYGRPPQ